MSNKNLYNSEFEINDLLRRAHPGGSKEVFSSPTGEGIVEDGIDTQKKILQMVSREPIFKVLASLADELDSEGLFVLSNKVDNLIKKAISDHALKQTIKEVEFGLNEGRTPAEMQKREKIVKNLRATDPSKYNVLRQSAWSELPNTSGKKPPPPPSTPTTTVSKAPGTSSKPSASLPPSTPKPPGQTIDITRSDKLKRPTTTAPSTMSGAPAAGTRFSRLGNVLRTFINSPVGRLAGRILTPLTILQGIYSWYQVLSEVYKSFEAYRESQGLWDATLETIKADLEKIVALLKSGKSEDLVEGQRLFSKVGHWINTSLNDKDMTPEDFKKLKVLKDAYDKLDQEIGGNIIRQISASAPAGSAKSKSSPGRQSDRYAYKIQEKLLANDYPVGTASGKPDGIWGRTSNASMLEYATNLANANETKQMGDSLLPLVGKTPAETTSNLPQIYSLLYGKDGQSGKEGRRSMPKDTWAIDFTSSVTNKEIKGFPLSHTIRGLNIQNPETTAESSHDHKLYLESMGALPPNSSVRDLINVNVDITRAAEESGIKNVGPILRLTEVYFDRLEKARASRKTIWDVLDSEFAQFGRSHPYYKVKDTPSGKKSLLDYLIGQDLCDKDGMVTAPIGTIHSSILSIERASQNLAQNLGLR